MKVEMRWREKDRRLFTTNIRKFNTSVTKLSKQHPELADAGLLPSKLDINSLRASGMTRKEFNILMRNIERWFKPESREIITRGGIRMTRWEYQNTLNAVQRINYQKRKTREAAKNSSRQRKQTGEDKSVSAKLSNIQQRMEQSNEYSEFTPEMATEAWKSFVATVNRQSTEEYREEQNALYYYNYNKAIYENFSDGNDTSLANFVEDFRLTGEELFNLIAEFPVLDIDYMYGPEEEDAKIEVLYETLPYAVSKVLGNQRAEEGVERFYSRLGDSSRKDYKFRLYGQ